jgi:hypothetical protein
MGDTAEKTLANLETMVAAALRNTIFSKLFPVKRGRVVGLAHAQKSC